MLPFFHLNQDLYEKLWIEIYFYETLSSCEINLVFLNDIMSNRIE